MTKLQGEQRGNRKWGGRVHQAVLLQAIYSEDEEEEEEKEKRRSDAITVPCKFERVSPLPAR